MAPLSALCWLLSLAQWISNESGRWPHTFLDDAEHYGYENNLFDFLYEMSSLSALVTMLCVFLLLPAIVSLWAFDSSRNYRRRWLLIAALSWATLLVPRIRDLYTVLSG